jgi:hypothetical protein
MTNVIPLRPARAVPWNSKAPPERRATDAEAFPELAELERAAPAMTRGAPLLGRY